MKLRNAKISIAIFGVTAALSVLDGIAALVLDMHKDTVLYLYLFRWITAAIALFTACYFLWISRKDKLTNMPDRDYLIRTLGKLQASHQTFILAYIAIERFSLLNNTLGHEKGDELLLEVARCLRSVTKDETKVYKAGSRSFSFILLDHYEESHVIELCSTVKTLLRLPTWSNQKHCNISLDLNCSYVRNNGTLDAYETLRRCSVAATVASVTKSITGYSPEIDTFSLEGLTLATGLRYAVEHDQIALVYQPKVDLKLKRVTSMELLSRWDHPEFKMLSPDKFVPYAEQAGTISFLTNYALSQGLAQLSAWKKDGLDLKLAINISAACLESSLVSSVMSLMGQHSNLKPEDLIFELTETSLLANPEAASRILTCLSLMGHKISIDDFGTGHSSMLYLRNMPITEIKLDKVFVAGMMTSNLDLKIVDYTIKLGHELGCTLVAEGVENVDTLDKLIALDCDVAQGYLFSRPVDAKYITAEFLDHIGQAF